jgi:hypothetical protein
MNFAPHMRQIFARRGAAASYAPASGPALSCQAIRQGGGQPIMLGPVRVIVDRTFFHVLRSDVPAPAAGGVLTLGGDAFTVEAVQPVERDVDRLMWQIEAEWGAAVGYRSVTGSGSAQNPPQGAGFTLAAAASAGAAAISIRSAFTVGKLLAGDKLTIAPVATVYTVTGAGVQAAANQFSAVPITPVLAANAALGAAVTFDFARDYGVRAGVAAYAAHEFQGGVLVGDRRLAIFQAGLTAAGMTDAPKASDRVTFEGKSFNVISAAPLYRGDTAFAWDVQVRA